MTDHGNESGAVFSPPESCECGSSTYFINNEEITCAECDMVLDTRSEGSTFLKVPSGVRIEGEGAADVMDSELAEELEEVDVSVEDIIEELGGEDEQ